LQGVLHWWSHPSAVRVPDGNLWFVTGTGIAVVDPPRLPPRASSREPRIARVLIDGTPYTSGERLRLPPGASTLQIEYTTLALSGASKFRFRYMLEGLNPDWVDAGARR